MILLKTVYEKQKIYGCILTAASCFMIITLSRCADKYMEERIGRKARQLLGREGRLYCLHSSKKIRQMSVPADS
jgi:hypothetical protein